ncbi:chromatin assembly factor 1 subunit A-domain-containing protein [Colletotrichum navitas]|uniref:Chromatin assembly factor 1 subunit A-domain-containing protein n=1 Tax=Colletotrichum navitas TaxID=681940 RepID=A0AAD8PRR2_9PEZI|nr:chromatin assembly factor 1 subunit A-domain-containing protein [Colletotrichum navitas]KAK1574581.1 chromatin assembly factor 1 subunit A-domain-containing protein [Colletotrichum navitas]
MPLFEMSTNVQRESDMEPNGLKRSHDDFSTDQVTMDHRGLAAGVKQQAIEAVVQPARAVSPAPQMRDRDSMSPLSSPGSLSDLSTITPPRNSPSPNPTPTKIPFSLKPTPDANISSSNPSASNPTPSANQSAKRKRRTAAEKEAEEKEKAQKKKEREEKKEAKQAEKAKADAEKQAKLNEKRRKKEEEERKIQEDKEKKERAQPKLLSFFKPPATPKKETAAANVKPKSPGRAAATSDSAAPVVKKEEKSQYEKLFKPFYVHSTVRLAKNPFEMDQETHEAKTKILEEYFNGKREPPAQVGKFDPVGIFQLPCRPAARGRIYPPVRYTMEKMMKLTQHAQGVSEEDKKAAMKEATDALRHIPIKHLKFYQDVRPAYRGTVTLKPYQAGKSGMRRLARKPTLRDQLPLNYEHDSEAEWESEGEDVDMDDEDDEDLDDGDGDMDGFLDDSDDNGPARFVSANGLEPESTGLCWEDRKRIGPNRTVYEHRMEFILETLDHHSGIDPFSTKYWEPEPKPKPKPKPAGQPPKDKAATESLKPSDAFKAISSAKVGGGGVQSLPKKMLENNNLEELKKVIEANPKIAKGGLIDLSYVALAHAKISRNEIKEAIAAVAEKVGGKGHAGSWTIKPGFDT